jgi:hypothetical protein
MLTALPGAFARWLERETNLVRCLPVIDESSPWAVCVARLRSRKVGVAETLFINCLKAVSGREATEPPAKATKTVRTQKQDRRISGG